MPNLKVENISNNKKKKLRFIIWIRSIYSDNWVIRLNSPPVNVLEFEELKYGDIHNTDFRAHCQCCTKVVLY